MRIDLDWTRLLGFDHCDAQANSSGHTAKVGSKIPRPSAHPSHLGHGLNAKVGAKQMLRRAGELDSVALSRLTKVGLKSD